MLLLADSRRVVSVALLACGVCYGCRPEDSRDERPLAVVVSGDTAGWIVPCGCASNQSGGLPRRASYVTQLCGEVEVILADAGGAPSGESPYDRVKFEAILKGEVAMGIAAHNVGAAEAALGADYLRRVTKQLDVPLVSANVRDEGGQPLAEPLRVIEAAGRRVAVVGVLGEQFATDELTVSSPRQAVLDALRTAAGTYDSVVVLAYLEERELRQLAETLPEADAVVGGPTRQPVPPTHLGPTLLTSSTKQGKFLVRLDAPGPEAADRRWSGRIVELDTRFEDDPEQAANLKKFYEVLARRDFTPAETSLAELLPPGLPEDYRIAGTRNCRTCHEEDDRLWQQSRHAGAWRSLSGKGAQVDPDCQRCHTTGYGLPGGFASVTRSPQTVDVGCESCHGPSQAHVRDVKIGTTYRARAKGQCVVCHDRENSPQFDYDEYWAQILHGQSPGLQPDAVAASRNTSEDGQ